MNARMRFDAHRFETPVFEAFCEDVQMQKERRLSEVNCKNQKMLFCCFFGFEITIHLQD